MSYILTINTKNKTSNIIVDSKTHLQALSIGKRCTNYRGAELVNIQPLGY